VFSLALPAPPIYLRFMLREHTPVLGWPLGIVYSVFLAAALMVVLRRRRDIRPAAGSDATRA